MTHPAKMRDVLRRYRIEAQPRGGMARCVLIGPEGEIGEPGTYDEMDQRREDMIVAALAELFTPQGGGRPRAYIGPWPIRRFHPGADGPACGVEGDGRD